MKPGLLVLHGNRVESLADVVFAWLGRHPLAPLEEEVVLVQSNGMAEWFKMNLAQSHGVCAATRVELPARFLWRLYRALLGREAVPAVLAGDKQSLLWRLMASLPGWLTQHETDVRWKPLIEAWQGGSQGRDGLRTEVMRYNLCAQIADLFDQYQIYRPDWLRDWAEGRDHLRGAPLAARAAAQSIPEGHAWQPLLWRAVLAGMSPLEQICLRPALHARCMQMLQTTGPGQERPWPEVPRRVILFACSQLPYSTLELIAALSQHVQIVMAVPNPCRYYWADLIDGREQFSLGRRRQPPRGNLDLAALPLAALQSHGHPLLAAWGRQARDFVRQLDAFDDGQRSQERFDLARLDLFDDDMGVSLLRQIQDRIRDGVPLLEHQEHRPLASDGSVRFQLAHSAQREVEALYDQLLHLFAHPPQDVPLAPRDVVVMVPNIDDFAASIRAVFGQYARGDARHIPWGIADVHRSGQSPLLRAVEWLLGIRQHRLSVSEWRDLLELPACAARFGISDDRVSLALDWLTSAGVRWGLHAEQRASLGLDAAGDVNTWHFGVQRLLLGFAAGELADGYEGQEPFCEVAGLAADLAGALSQMASTLDDWWRDAGAAQRPNDWAARLRLVLQDMFLPRDDIDRAAWAALDDALAQWLQACDAAGFDEPVSLAVVRQAWLSALNEPSLSQRFKAGGVTFCTLMPLRAVPFEVVCLLGMNDGDYPRASVPSNFDLMGVPGLGRPGDRSRRHDDRQLMLDAVLSARRVLAISWTGRSHRDNTVQPPSVLVSQLRDYIDAAWGTGVCAERTVVHPLQPFSRRYFEQAEDQAGGLFTYASEWRQAHGVSVEDAVPAQADPRSAETGAASPALAPDLVLDLRQLGAFMRNPVKYYFRHRLKVVFDIDETAQLEDDEAFSEKGLPRLLWLRDLLDQTQTRSLDDALRKLAREGQLPLAGPGQMATEQLRDTLAPMLAERQRRNIGAPAPAPALDIDVSIDAAGGRIGVRDVLGDLLSDDAGNLLVVDFLPKSLRGKSGGVREDRLVDLWVKSLACAASGRPVRCVGIGTDAVVQLEPLEADLARSLLHDVLQLVDASLRSHEGGRPLATALMTGLAWLRSMTTSDGDEDKAAAAAELVYEGNGSMPHARPEYRDACLRRTFPTFDAMAAQPCFRDDTRRLYGPLLDLMPAQLEIQTLPDATADDEAPDA